MNHSLALEWVTHGRVRFWLPTPFSRPSGYFIDESAASEAEHVAFEALTRAGLIRLDTETLPYNRIVLTPEGRARAR